MSSPMKEQVLSYFQKSKDAANRDMTNLNFEAAALSASTSAFELAALGTDVRPGG